MQQKQGWIQRARQSLGRILGMAQRSYMYFIPSSEVGAVQPQQINLKNAANDGYKKAIWVYRCINEIANRISSVPFKIIKKSSGEEYVGAHPLKKILEKPNQQQSWVNFLKMQSILLNITGNNYYDISERIGNKPANIYLLRPDRMKIVPGRTRRSQDASGHIDHYEYYLGGDAAEKILPENILHHKKFDPTNDWYGLSPIQVASYSIDTETQAKLWNYNMFRNQARPSGVLQSDSPINDDEYKRLQEEMRINWMGTSNTGRPIILEGGLKWVQTALSQRDSDLILLMKLTREEICGIFGVPPLIVGILDRATYSNFREANPIFWEQTIIPDLTELVDFWDLNICSLYGDDIGLAYDLSDVKALKESQDNKDKRAKDYFLGGIITRNQAQIEGGWEPDPKGNFYLLPPGYTPYYEDEDVTAQTPVVAEKKNLNIELSEEYAPAELRAAILDLSDNEADDYILISSKRQDKYAKSGAKEIQGILQDYYENVAKRLESAENISDADKFLKQFEKEHIADLHAWYEDYYRSGLQYFGNLTLQDLKKSLKRGYEFRAEPIPKNFDLADFVVEWLETVTGERVVDVADTTKEQLKRIIEDGIISGATAKEISNEIFELTEINTYLRAARIAITEAHSIACAGNFYAMIEADLGKGLKKIWHTNIDGRERPSHATMSGQKVLMKKAFKSGLGKKLMFPGDSSLGAGAADIVHCRCAIIYDTTAIGGLYEGE